MVVVLGLEIGLLILDLLRPHLLVRIILFFSLCMNSVPVHVSHFSVFCFSDDPLLIERPPGELYGKVSYVTLTLTILTKHVGLHCSSPEDHCFRSFEETRSDSWRELVRS